MAKRVRHASSWRLASSARGGGPWCTGGLGVLDHRDGGCHCRKEHTRGSRGHRLRLGGSRCVDVRPGMVRGCTHSHCGSTAFTMSTGGTPPPRAPRRPFCDACSTRQQPSRHHPPRLRLWLRRRLRLRLRPTRVQQRPSPWRGSARRCNRSYQSQSYRIVMITPPPTVRMHTLSTVN